MDNTVAKFSLWTYVKRNSGMYVILAILYFGRNLGQIGASIFQGNALTALTQHSLKGFIVDTGLNLLSWGFFLIFFFCSSRYSAVIIKAVDNSIRNALAHIIGRQEYEGFNKHTEADYVSWFTNDINQINQDGFFSLEQTYSSALLGIIASVILLSYHPLLFVTTLVFAVVMILFPRLFKKKLEELSQKQSSQNEVLTAKATDALEGFVNLLTLGQQKLLNKIVYAASDKAGQARVNYITEMSFSNSLINLISIFAQTILTVESGYLAFHNQLPIGAIIIVGSLSGNVFGSLTGISIYLTSIRAVQPIFDKYNKLTNAQKKTGDKDVAPLTQQIAFSDLSFSYPNSDRPILTNVAGSIKRGERVAIVGPSGCGKSTLVKLIGGLLTGYQGSLTWDNDEYRELNLSSLHKQIAYIDQSAYIFDGSLRYNITLDREATDKEVNAAITHAGLEEFVADNASGLDTVLKHAGNNISGGQKQRIALARQLLGNPQVILADEITSAIDEKDGQKIEQSLLDLDNITLIYISHHLRPEIKKQFDQVIELG
ncbi:ABC transporter ATP-binding/membrane spanning protein - multidrug resistance [Lactobacillus sp. wkB8]|uniref:ABC transporter ATP-binding protein n=1 Tax=Lactobacillus sp. wkB8 TaxID=1545702 RepID=UPI00050D7988|nr:ABC transporter ATP-binding protein [Lactobacillus sp. wkB8]AIS10069.1 ABC transporter ATP-binding/membrane spanning protein - multidrug resistance [Lactobacillus sp. wkB8]